ncbi:hypothetical protein OE766_26685 [Pararhizobium sp. YC-54]|uniref:hypothetical protein n=1 Tax=Pararhizobium sp. YC-54 TaxID=2986920 RepID=UPI0021F7AF75|nr:hypothetical protein [Pararhizobium sp. YC-54]MCW0001806.1 hypothetical protein [Pararhizobium sp. YC-54]
MRKQTKPFIVEVKPSRKPKSGLKKTSIWGRVDLRTDGNAAVAATPEQEPAAVERAAGPD